MADRRRLALIAAGCAVALLVLWLWVEHRELPGDQRLFDLLRDDTPGGRDAQVATFFGDIGNDAVALLTVLVTALVLLRTVGPRAAVLVVAAGAIGALNYGLKDLFGPTELGQRQFGTVDTFPSGHVAYAAAFFGALALLGRAHGRPEAVWVSLGLIVGMGVARVHSGSHLPSDALAGYLVGAGWLAALLAVLGPGVLRR